MNKQQWTSELSSPSQVYKGGSDDGESGDPDNPPKHLAFNYKFNPSKSKQIKFEICVHLLNGRFWRLISQSHLNITLLLFNPITDGVVLMTL